MAKNYEMPMLYVHYVEDIVVTSLVGEGSDEVNVGEKWGQDGGFIK